MALKNWTKKSATKYINKRRKGTLYIGKSLFTGKPDVAITIDTVKMGKARFPKTHVYKEFKARSSAVRFAKNFMKKN